VTLPASDRDREYQKFRDTVSGPAVAVVADSLPLPSGAATEAKQDDIITAINNISNANGFLTSAIISSVASSTETTIVTYTVPLLGTFNLNKVHASGTADGLFRLKKNAVTIATRRNNWTERNITFDYGSLFFSASDVITLTVVHNELAVQDFSGEIYGS